jgi:iron complex outermembrane receptor protein
MMEYRRQHAIPDVDVSTLGLYARWRRPLSAATELEVGGRIDRVSSRANPDLAATDLYQAYHGTRSTSSDDTEASATVQLVHSLAPSLSLTGSLATATRSPDPRERYFGLRRMGGDWVGNPELDPPRSTSAELGLTWDLGAGVITAKTWVDRVDGFITLYDQARAHDVAGVMSSKATSYANVDATLRGVALQATTALSMRLSVAGQVTYMEGRKDRSAELGLESTNLAEMPPLTARLALRWQNPRLFAEVEGVTAARQDEVDIDLRESPTPGWGVVNLKAGVSRGPWRAQIALDNLFDRTYHEHFSYLRDPFRTGTVVNEPGRRFTVTLGWRL